MTNEEYLIHSYFLACLLSLALAAMTYLWLRHPFTQIAEALSKKALSCALRRSFPLGLFLPALAAFLSVSYYEGCSRKPYDQIVADRAYLIAKNQQQISETLGSLVMSVFLWGLVVLLVLIALRRTTPKETHTPPRNQ